MKRFKEGRSERNSLRGGEGVGSPRAGLGHLVAPDEGLILPAKSLDPLVQLSILLFLRFQVQRG